MNLTPLIAAAHEGLHRGHPDIEHLYELGKRGQWNASDLPWESLDLVRLPAPLRLAIGELLTQIHYGELAALTTSARLVQEAPLLTDRLFGANQVADEGRHVEWFSRLVYRLDAPAKVQPQLAAFIDSVTATRDQAELLIGMNILIEGLALTLMRFAGKLLRTADADDLGALVTLGEWLVDHLAQDESRHLAFGIRRVGQLVHELEPARRARLEARVETWANDLLALTKGRCDGVSTLGLDGDALMARCLADTRSRFELAGLSLALEAK